MNKTHFLSEKGYVFFVFSQTTLVSGSPFLLPLNGEELPTGIGLSQTPWGREKNFSLLFFFLVYRFLVASWKFEDLGNPIFTTQTFSKQQGV